MEVLNKPVFLEPEIHEKGWGREIWVINNFNYCLKFLEFKKGTSGSMHFHNQKMETWYIESGEIEVTFINTQDASQIKHRLVAGQSVHIPVLCPHQVVAIQDSRIIEASTTHHELDSYRVIPGSSQKK